jgi:poly(A) polymerase
VGENKPVAPSFLLACVLWADVRDGWEARLKAGHHPYPALQDAVDDVFNARIGDVSGRGKLGADMRDIWMMQPRFDKRVGAGPFTMVEQPRFRAGFDFLRLRAGAGEVTEELATWWEDFSLANDATREDLMRKLRESNQSPRRVAKAPKVHRVVGEQASTALAVPAGPEQDGQVGVDSEPGDAPRKRRRRRRKPGAGGSDSASSPVDGGT